MVVSMVINQTGRFAVCCARLCPWDRRVSSHPSLRLRFSMHQRVDEWEGLLGQKELVFQCPALDSAGGPHSLGHVDLTCYGHFCNSSGSYLMATYHEPGRELGCGFTGMNRLGP